MTAARAPEIGANHLSAWVLIAAAPPFYALASWAAFAAPRAVAGLLNRYSMPIVMIEMLVVGASLARGFRPLRPSEHLPVALKSVIAMLVALSWGTALLRAPDQPAAVAGTYCTTIHILFGLALFSLARNAPQMSPYRLWRLLLAGHLVFLVVVAAFVIAMWDTQGFDWLRFRLAGSNVRHLSYYSATGSLIALGLAVTDPKRPRYWGYTAVAAAFAGLSFWTGSRGAIVAVLAALPLCALVSPSFRGRSPIMASLVSICAGAMLAATLPIPAPNFGIQRIIWSTASAESGVDALSSGRVAMWRSTLAKIAEQPMLGLGENQFRSQVPAAGGSANQPHNAVLQILLQWGVVGLALVAILAVMLAARMKRVVDTAPSATAPAISVIAGLLIFSLYDGTLYYPYPIMMLVTAVAIILGQDRPEEKDQAGTRLR